jgi:hypothetical protein
MPEHYNLIQQYYMVHFSLAIEKKLHRLGEGSKYFCNYFQLEIVEAKK